MNLALRDQKIFQLKAEVENRKKMLCAKRHQLKANVSENSLLKNVLDDYEQYNKHIIEHKNKQIAMFQTLNQYIDNITTDLQLTDSKLRESKQEQREIIKEISILKKEIDDLV
jgi:hypothetical protein